MTGEIIIALAAVLAIIAIALWRKSSPDAKADTRDLTAVYLDSFPAKHPKYFPVIRQALSRNDAKFLAERVAREPRRRALRARRAAARFFLEGLRHDFDKLTNLSRVLAKAAPESAHATEMERLKLEWKFRSVYAVIWVKLRIGAVPTAQLHALADTIGSMASRLEIAVNAWQDASLLSHPELMN